MEAQELFSTVKKDCKSVLGKKNYQQVCSFLGNMKQNYETFCTTESFDSAKQAVSKMQSLFSKIESMLPQSDKKMLKKFISSCQSEVNEYGAKEHNHFMELLEHTGATINGVPSFMFSGSSDDYVEYQIRRTMAEGLR